MKNKTNTTITISIGLARKLRIWKAELGCKTIEEVIDRILKIVPASQLDTFKIKKGGNSK